MDDRLRILLLAANPLNTPRLDLEAEHRLLRNRMRDNVEAGNCEILAEWAARPGDLQLALVAFKPHVVHFAGHGSGGAISLEDDAGKSHPLSKQELQLLLTLALEHLRLVVLNACTSAPQLEQLRQSVDYVISTNCAVADEDAVRFTADFYRALAGGETVREAFNKAQGGPAGGGRQGAAAPYELLVRDGVSETEPLLPPFEGNRISFNTGRLTARKAVVADVIQRGSGPPPPPGATVNKRNKVEVRSDSADVGELYVGNEYRETDRGGDGRGEG